MAHSIACLVLPNPSGLLTSRRRIRFPSSVLSRRKEEPLDDLAQPLLGFLGREEGGAGGWRHCQKTGMGGGLWSLAFRSQRGNAASRTVPCVGHLGLGGLNRPNRATVTRERGDETR